MKNSNQKLLKATSTLLFVITLVFTTPIHAQAPPTGVTNTQDSNNSTQDSIPLDGGFAALLIGAAAYGIKKLRNNK